MGPPSGLIAVHWHPSLETDRPVAEVTTLRVAPDDRRRGIGRLLLKAAARSAQLAGCETLRLSVRHARNIVIRDGEGSLLDERQLAMIVMESPLLVPRQAPERF